MITTIQSISLDGVMQAPGAPDEDPRGGFGRPAGVVTAVRARPGDGSAGQRDDSAQRDKTIAAHPTSPNENSRLSRALSSLQRQVPPERSLM